MVDWQYVTSTRRTRALEIRDQHAGLARPTREVPSGCQPVGHSAPRDMTQEPTQERTQIGEDRLGETSARRTRPLETRDQYAELVVPPRPRVGRASATCVRTAHLSVTALAERGTAASSSGRVAQLG